MARTKTKPVEPNVADETPAAHALTVAEGVALRTIEEGYSEERDLLNQLLGQAQMAGAFEEFSRTVRTSKLAFVKENKLYRLLAGKKSPNGSECSGSWEEFCSLLGMSVDKADMDITNLRAFGEEALESMSRMGIGYRELRQYRRLPEDQKTALIEAATAGDKDTFLELAEDLIAKHAKEKETLTSKVSELEADAEATGRVIEEKNRKLDELAKRLKKIERTTEPWPERYAALNEEAGTLGTAADEVMGHFLTLLSAVETLADTTPPEHEAAARSTAHRLGEAVERLCHLAASLRDQFETRLAHLIAEDRSHLLGEAGTE